MTAFFLLTRLCDTDVLLVPEKGGYALPSYDQAVPANVGFESPEPYNVWFARRFGVEVVRLYALDHEGAGFVVFVLEPRTVAEVDEEVARWVGAHELTSVPFASEMHRSFLLAWFANTRASVTMPWARSGGYDDAFEWMRDTLYALAVAPQGNTVQVKNAYVSSVFRVPTNEGDVYLKLLPALFIRESAIVAELAEWKIAELPERLAMDVERGYVLMRDMGGRDLSECLSIDFLIAAARRYAVFQVASTERIDVENPWPFYDLRISVLFERLGQLVEDIPELLADSPYRFDADEVDRLRARTPHWKALCTELEDLGLPDAVEHGDLRPGNIRVIGDRMIFYDWALSSITHPFFSVVSLMHIVRSTLEIEEGSREMLRDAYLEAWKPYGTTRELHRAFELADRLKAVYGAISDADWVRAVLDALPAGTPDDTHPDAWTLRRRQYYFAEMARRLL